MDPSQRRRAWRASFAFAVVGLVALEALARLTLATPLSEVVVAPEVWRALRRSSLSPQATTLVLVDSVARQLYNQHNEDATGYLHLTTNQAVSMAGQYLLLERTLATHPRLERVVLVYRPTSFANDLDQTYTFNNFVKPFCDLGTWSQLPDSVHERIRRRPLWWLGLLPLVKASRIASEIDYSSDAKEPDPDATPRLSPVSAEFLKRMDILARSRGFALTLRSVPVRDQPRMQLGPLRDAVEAAGLSTLFAGYFESIEVLEAAKFIDGSHLLPKVVDELGPNPLKL